MHRWARKGPNAKMATAGRHQGQFNLNFIRRKSKFRQTGKSVCEYVNDILYRDGALGKRASRTYCWSGGRCSGSFRIITQFMIIIISISSIVWWLEPGNLDPTSGSCPGLPSGHGQMTVAFPVFISLPSLNLFIGKIAQILIFFLLSNDCI